jgi:septum formation protein
MQGIEDLSAPQDLEPTKDEIWNPDQALVLGADTVVAVDGKILGKPRTHAEAADMIRALQGRSHEVYTGVTIFGTLKDDQATDHNASMGCSTFYEETKVHVAAMTEEEILAYARTEEPMDKAGAYGIQGSFGKYISGIEGDYYNVVGLPIAHVYQELKKFL